MLLVGLGRATRLLRFLQEAGKEYRARVVFGVATDTLDASGAVLERTEMTVTRDELDVAARAFVGDIEQVPPMVSALKVGGRRLYEMARAGEEIERAARPVRIDELVVEDFEPGAYPEATIRVACSSGNLRPDARGRPRRRVGRVRAPRLVAPTARRQLHPRRSAPDRGGRGRSRRGRAPPTEAVRDLECVRVDAERARAVAHGATFAAPALLGDRDGAGPFAVVDDAGALLAVYERRGGGVKPSVVLATEAAIS